jgi:endonuclease/exonuclease/phosphatase family metal-dependent hydrolase
MRVRRLAPVLLAGSIGTAGCAPVYNFVDPTGPRYAGGRYQPRLGENPGGARYVGTAATAPGTAPRLRVVTFNIRYAREIERAIALLERAPLREADILTLQEMDARGVERIADALGMAYVYYPAAALPTRNKDFGNAVLVRGTIEDDRKVLLPHAGRFGGMRRIAVGVTANLAGRQVRVYSAHLGTPKDISDGARRAQVAAIAADARGSGLPVIVAGDFNNRGGVARAFTEAGFGWVTRGVGRTISVFSWDHVFVRGFDAAMGMRSGAVRSNGASDHRAVWVELPLPRKLEAAEIAMLAPASLLESAVALSAVSTARPAARLPIR